MQTISLNQEDDTRPKTGFTTTTSSSSSFYSLEKPGHDSQDSSSNYSVWGNILRMFTTFDYTSPSLLTGFSFTLGSIVWVINGCFAWLPLAAPSTEFAGELTAGTGYSAFIGAAIFEIGGVFLLIEALNENDSRTFPWETKTVTHALDGRSVVVGLGGVKRGRVWRHGSHNDNDSNDMSPSIHDSWILWPSWSALRSHYFHKPNFWAAIILFVGATVFWVAGITSMPGVIDFTNVALTNAAYWTPQLIGGVGFITSSMIFTIQTQQKWWRPAFGVLGWYVGVWNLAGSIGFTACAILGFYAANPVCLYWASLTSFLGSCSFLIGSSIQWYQAVDRSRVQTTRRLQVLTGVPVAIEVVPTATGYGEKQFV